MRPCITASLLLAALAVPSPLPAQTVFQPGQVGAVLGRMVVDKSGDDIGRIVDILVDPDGRPRVAIMDVGGFMGIGTRRVAVAWRSLRFTHDIADPRIIEEMTMDEVAAAPEYHGTDVPVRVLGPATPK